MINKFEIINPTIDKSKPYLNRRKELVIPHLTNYKYKWYLEVARDNVITGDRDYFILFSKNKFDDNCLKIIKDYGCRTAIMPIGELAIYIYREIKNRANIEINYLYSEDNFDVFEVK